MSRSWPLWGLLSAVGSLVPLYFLLELTQNHSVIVTPNEFAEGLYGAATMFAPGFTAGYAVLCAMVVWGYLYNPKAVGMFHALPVDRTCLFITNTVSGLVMVIIPYAVTGLLLCLLALCWGFFHLAAVLNTVLAILLLTVTFFGMSTLCAMLTGHIIMLPALYILLNFLAPLLEALIFSLTKQFLIGIGPEGTFMDLSPVLGIYGKFTCNYNYNYYGPDAGENTPVLNGLLAVALYALAGLVMLALAWFLYKKRHSECAGDVVAFRWMRPVFRYGLAMLSGLTLGRLLYELLWGELFQQGDYYDALPMFLCLLVTGLVGYYAASMLLAKSKRVFRGSIKGVGIVCAGAAALILLVSVDVFGAERRVPPVEDIASVTLVDRGISSGPFSPEENPEQVELIRSFHQAIVNDRNYIRSYRHNEAAWSDASDEDWKVSNHHIWLTYQLKNGSTLRRTYELWLTKERMGQNKTYDCQLANFYQNAEVKRRSVMIPENAALNGTEIYCDYSEDYYTYTEADNARKLYDALLQDADEGHVPTLDILAPSTKRSSLWIEFEYQIPLSLWDGSWTYAYKDVCPCPEMTHTLDTLVDLGLLSEDAREKWTASYGQDGTIESVWVG